MVKILLVWAIFKITECVKFEFGVCGLLSWVSLSLPVVKT